ncbi:MAG: phage/plasmid primase, P4 family, partial [Planctomycetota bacterium]
MPESVDGANGSKSMMAVVRALRSGFNLEGELFWRILNTWNDERAKPPWRQHELDHAVDSVEKEPSQHERGWLLNKRQEDPFKEVLGMLEEDDGKRDDFTFTDAEQAWYIARHAGDRIRFAAGVGWLWWDGKRWATSDERVPSQVLALAKEAWDRRWSEVCAHCANMSADKAGKIVSRAKRLGDMQHIRAALELARAEAGIAIDAKALDAHPWLLNCENGTIDLQSGELRPHRREDMLTKLAPVEYRPDARHEALERILANIGSADPALPNFLARCFGVSLTGDASTESLFLIQGDAGNGKTTLTEAFAAILGDYAVKLPFSSFVASKNTARSGHGASPDLVRLRGARFAFAAEGEQSAKLDAGLVKQLTGNERVTARRLYADQIEFAQTFKLWLVSNFDPRMDADDVGIWRRVVKVSFPPLDPAKRDPGVKKALVQDPAAQAALLAWAVRGCQAWLAAGGGRRGLEIPASVEAATQDLRDRFDTVALWLGECDEHEVAGKPASEVRCAYETWCRGTG